MSNKTAVFVDGYQQRFIRSFLKTGLDGFEPREALEMLLFYVNPKDAGWLADTLLRRFGSFVRVLEADFEALAAADGVGEEPAAFLKLVFESFRYYEKEKTRPGFSAASAASVKKFVKSLYIGEKNEIAYVLCLDAGLGLTDCVKLTEGTVSAAAVSARRVVEIATVHKAAAVILCHNHPGGVAVPSPEDLRATRNVLTALEAIGIELADHIIVSGREALSFADTGALESIR